MTCPLAGPAPFLSPPRSQRTALSSPPINKPSANDPPDRLTRRPSGAAAADDVERRPAWASLRSGRVRGAIGSCPGSMRLPVGFAGLGGLTMSLSFPALGGMPSNQVGPKRQGWSWATTPPSRSSPRRSVSSAVVRAGRDRAGAAAAHVRWAGGRGCRPARVRRWPRSCGIADLSDLPRTRTVGRTAAA